MKPSNVHCFIFLYIYRFCLSKLTTKKETFRLQYHTWCMRAKQTIVYGRGPSNINLGIFVCSFSSLPGVKAISLY